MHFLRRAALMTALLACLGLAGTASAAVEDGTGDVELYIGWFFADDGGYESANFDDITYGIRFGYLFTDRFGIQGAIGHWEGSDSWDADVDLDGTLEDVEVEPDATFVDVSFEWHANPDGKGVFVFFFGPGYAFQDIDVWWDGGGQNVEIDDSFTLHAGLGGKIEMTDRFYLRPEARIRWIDESWDPDEEDRYDWDVTIGFGWVFGK